MKTTLLRRGLVGLIFALPLAFASVAFAQGEDPLAPAQSEEPDCGVCHAEIQEVWEQGAHHQATFDPVFVAGWDRASRDPECLQCHTTGFDPETGSFAAEGVTCQACHGEYKEGHPNEPMEISRSPEMCGQCHTETHFEWQASTHREVQLACSGCHDPHRTEILADDSSQLCGRCHQSRSDGFDHTAHSLEGLTCGDCHLDDIEGELGSGHATRDHSFNVRLTTCNKCHAYQMHDPVAVHEAEPTPVAMSVMTSTLGPSLGEEPSPVSPLGFAVLAGFSGMAAGMILSPWLERWFTRMREEE